MCYQCKYCTILADGYYGHFENLNYRTSFVFVSHETLLFQKELRKKEIENSKCTVEQKNTFAEDLGLSKKEEENKPLLCQILKKDEIYFHYVLSLDQELISTSNGISSIFYQ